MPDNPSDRSRSLVPQGQPLSEAGWAKQAVAVRGPFAALAFGIRVAANVRAMQDAIAHAKVYGQLMDVAAETMGKIQKAQDTAREYAVRQELSGELHGNEIDRQRDNLADDAHKRAVAGKRRTQELVVADTDILLARQTQRAKKKFETFKHEIGVERFKTEAARRQVGAAEARLAISEAGKPEAASQPEAPRPVAQPADSPAAIVSGLLEGVRLRLREMRADGEDTEERAQLVAEEAALERTLARLLSAKG
jgi:L-lactate utilization protein LutC